MGPEEAGGARRGCATAGGGGEGGRVGGRAWPLSAGGANGRSWGRIGARAPARAPISPPLSCTTKHNEERREVSARAVVIANSRDLVGLPCADPKVTQWGALSSALANQDHGVSERRRSHVDSNRTLPQHPAGPS